MPLVEIPPLDHSRTNREAIREHQRIRVEVTPRIEQLGHGSALVEVGGQRADSDTVGEPSHRLAGRGYGRTILHGCAQQRVIMAVGVDGLGTWRGGGEVSGAAPATGSNTGSIVQDRRSHSRMFFLPSQDTHEAAHKASRPNGNRGLRYGCRVGCERLKAVVLTIHEYRSRASRSFERRWQVHSAGHNCDRFSRDSCVPYSLWHSAVPPSARGTRHANRQ